MSCIAHFRLFSLNHHCGAVYLAAERRREFAHGNAHGGQLRKSGAHRAFYAVGHMFYQVRRFGHFGFHHVVGRFVVDGVAQVVAVACG